MPALKCFDKVIARVEGWLIITFLWLLVTFALIQVCLRALYTHGHFKWANSLMGHLDWSEPFVKLLVLWLTFLGASLVTRENKHIKIDLFSSFLPAKWHAVRELILSVASVIISATMLKVCIKYVKMEMEFGATLFRSFPTWAGELIIPAGFALILFRFLLRTIDQGYEVVKGMRE